MKLSKLIYQNIENDFDIAKLCLDSRKCVENSVFFAIKGTHQNGEDYISAAIKNGARAIIAENNFDLQKDIEFIKVDNIQKTLADYCEKIFTKLPKALIAVTGTNGKTSTACFVAKIANNLGIKSASIGTLGILLNGDINNNLYDSGLTTPDIITLYENLEKLHNEGISLACIEASSHGLSQGRLGNLKFKIAGFLNLSQDHLDYHNTMKEYFEAKKLLFRNHLETPSSGIFNSDIPEYNELYSEFKNSKSFGENSKDYKIENILPSRNGLGFKLNGKTIKTKVIGNFQAYNISCAIAMLHSIGYDFDNIIDACQNISAVRGRMEIISIPNKKAIAVVDYAHTPDALQKAIISLLKHLKGKVVVVFGCGGDRDKGKRKLMADVATKHANISIVTDDNPRTENANDIRKEIMKYCEGAIEIGDRKKAILKGLNLLEEGDGLLIAGKGHEDYQIIGTKKIHFDDREVVKNYLSEE